MKSFRFRLHKQFMTMIEVLIAMSLTIVLLTTLTFFYQYIQTLSTASEKLQRQSFHARYTENRLLQVFSNTIPEYNFKNTSLAPAFCFFTSENRHGVLNPNSDSLIFLYNNQAEANGENADVCLARLFLDKEGRFILASWKPPYEWPIGGEPPKARLEILLENVTEIGFEFFVPLKKDREPIKSTAINERQHYHETREPPPTTTVWLKHWDKEYNKLPPMIRISVKQKFDNTKGDPVETYFAFPLPYSQDLVFYD